MTPHPTPQENPENLRFCRRYEMILRTIKWPRDVRTVRDPATETEVL